MATTNRNYATPAHGSDVDTWDSPLNANFGLIDNNLGGGLSISTTGGTTTLNSTQQQYGVVTISGVLTSDATITWGAISGWYTVLNLTTGAHVVKIASSGGGNVICAPPGEPIDIFFDGTNAWYRNLGRVGEYVDFAATSVPTWVSSCTVPPYLYCNGSTYSSVTYPALYALLGTTTLPDFRGRQPAYVNDGTGRIISSDCGIDGNTLFAAGGVDAVALGPTQIPANIPYSDPGHVHTNTIRLGITDGTSFPLKGALDQYSYVVNTSSATTNITINPNGGGSHTNMGPTIMGGIRLIRAA